MTLIEIPIHLRDHFQVCVCLLFKVSLSAFLMVISSTLHTMNEKLSPHFDIHCKLGNGLL